MPEIDGFELADMIRQHPALSEDGDYLYFRGAPDRPDRLKGYQRGAVDYISVPVVPELLRAKVSSFRGTASQDPRRWKLVTRTAPALRPAHDAQDEERRRFARDLHDGIGPLIAALSMNNGMLAQRTKQLGTLRICRGLGTEQSVGGTAFEANSHHFASAPSAAFGPRIGLLPAIKMFAEGFAERSSVKVDVELSPEIGRLPPNVEISVFRIVQECLTNVYRHSGSKTAHIKIAPTQDSCSRCKSATKARACLAPMACRHPRDRLVGVGLSSASAFARTQSQLDVQSSENGTKVIAAVPVHKTMVKTL